MANINGTAGNDNIMGTASADNINGMAGNDVINGAAGDDYLRGGQGNDDVRGGQGNDQVLGDLGDDYLRGDLGNDRLYGGDGSDRAYGGADNDYVYGDNGVDYVYGEDGNDYVYGGADNDYAYGGNGDDVVRGDDGNDYVYGGAGADNLDGGNGNDNLYGANNAAGEADGADYITGGEGNDNINGQAGNDNLFGNNGDDTVRGGADNDQIRGDAGSDSLMGDAGDDTAYGGDGADTVQGNDGNDTLHGANNAAGEADGADAMDGGTGDDSVSGQSGNDTLQGGDGADTLRGGQDQDVLFGGNGNDVVQGDDGNDLSYGGDGADSLLGGEGNDTLHGANDVAGEADGADTIHGENGNDYISGQAGNDTLTGGAGNDTVRGGTDNDSLSGNTFEDSLAGDAGNDTVNGNEGYDTVSGGEGDDTAYGGDHADVINGDAGNDVLYGANNIAGEQDGHDTISGGDGNDTVNAQAGEDTVSGGDGNDFLRGGQGLDTLNGDAGNDSIMGDTHNDLLLGGAGADTVLGGEGDDVLHGANNVAGEADEGDTLHGEAGNDTISAQAGDDALTGGDGNDSLRGGQGNDTAEGGEGDDTVLGDLGNDSIQANAGNDFVQGGEGNDSIKGGQGLDYLEGNDGDDTLRGNFGADTLYGNAGNDVLDGMEENDLIRGGQGNDVVQGGTGQDTLFGDKGNDTTTGGEGEDIFALRTDDGSDTITDFEQSLWHEKVDIRRVLEAASFDELTITQDGSNAVLDLGNGQTLTLENVDANLLNSTDFLGEWSAHKSINVFNVGAKFDIIPDAIKQATLNENVKHYVVEGMAGDNAGNADLYKGFNLIDIRSFGINNLESLNLRDEGGNTVADLGGGRVLEIKGVSTDQLGEANFILNEAQGVNFENTMDQLLKDWRESDAISYTQTQQDHKVIHVGQGQIEYITKPLTIDFNNVNAAISGLTVQVFNVDGSAGKVQVVDGFNTTDPAHLINLQGLGLTYKDQIGIQQVGADTVLNIGAGKSVIVKNVEAGKLTEHLTGVVDRPEPELLGSYKVYHVTADKLAGYNTKTFVIDDINGSAENVVLLGGSFGDTLSASQVREENGYAIADLGDGYELKAKGLTTEELVKYANNAKFNNTAEYNFFTYDAHNLEQVANTATSNSYRVIPEEVRAWHAGITEEPPSKFAENFYTATANTMDGVSSVHQTLVDSLWGAPDAPKVYVAGYGANAISGGLTLVSELAEYDTSLGNATVIAASDTLLGSAIVKTSHKYVSSVASYVGKKVAPSLVGGPFAPWISAGLIVADVVTLSYTYAGTLSMPFRDLIRETLNGKEESIFDFKERVVQASDVEGDQGDSGGGNSESGSGSGGNSNNSGSGTFWNSSGRLDMVVDALTGNYTSIPNYTAFDAYINSVPEGGYTEIDGEVYQRQGDLLVKIDFTEIPDIDEIYDESGSDTLAGGAGDDALIAPEMFDIGAAFDTYAAEFDQGQVGEQAVAKFIVDAIKTGDLKAATENVAKFIALDFVDSMADNVLSEKTAQAVLNAIDLKADDFLGQHVGGFAAAFATDLVLKASAGNLEFSGLDELVRDTAFSYAVGTSVSFVLTEIATSLSSAAVGLQGSAAVGAALISAFELQAAATAFEAATTLSLAGTLGFTAIGLAAAGVFLAINEFSKPGKWTDNVLDEFDNVWYTSQTHERIAAEGGDDVLVGAAGWNVLQGGEGNDILLGGNNIDRPDELFGGAGDDYLNGNGNADDLMGGAGNDYLDGGSGDDLLMGGDDPDDYYTQNQNTGPDGNDTLVGGTGNDRLMGQDGDDVMDGGQGNDTMTGGAGRDTIVVKAATLDVDTVKDFNAAEDGVYLATTSTAIAYADGANTVIALGDGQRLVLENVAPENLNAQNLSGTVPQVIVGNVVETSATTIVQAGIHEIVTSKVNTSGISVISGNGNDEINITASVGHNVVQSGSGADTIFSGDGADELYGEHDNDKLSGGGGNDTLQGNEGADTVEGGEGNDFARGGRDDDNVSGGGGDDYLLGDLGNDTLTGGEGSDTFAFRAGDGHDLISDFNVLADYVKFVQMFGSVDDALATLRYDADRAVFDLSGGNQVELLGITSGISAGNIILASEV